MKGIGEKERYTHLNAEFQIARRDKKHFLRKKRRNTSSEINTIPMEKKCKEVKRLSEEALQIAVNRREGKKAKEKRKDIPI